MTPPRGELEPLTADLPAELAGAALASGEPRRWFVAIMGGTTKHGRWRIARRSTIVNVMGGADLDLTNAVVDGHVTEIHAFSLMGGSTIKVPDGVNVELTGFAIMGGNDFDDGARAGTSRRRR